MSISSPVAADIFCRSSISWTVEVREDVMTTALTMRAPATAGALVLLRGPAFAAPPVAEPVTPQLIEAATKEGKIVYYTGIDIKVAQALAKNFEKQYPGITVQVERTGSERIFQRVSQERASNIFAADKLQAVLFEGVADPQDSLLDRR